MIEREAIARLDQLAQASRVHALSAGTACAYYALGVKGDVVVRPTSVLFKGGYGKKSTIALVQGQPEGELPGTRIFATEKFPGSVKRTEYGLDLLQPLGAQLKAKHRYNELAAPAKRSRDAGYVIAQLFPRDIPDIKKLSDSWVANRLADPRVHRMSFTPARYYRCAQQVLEGRFTGVVFGLKNTKTGELIAVRVLSLAGDVAFDLAFFTARDIPWAARALQVLSLDALRARGVVYINFGESTGAGLSFFKLRLGAEKRFVYYGVA